jgi:exosortase A-associated hydrolase 2
MIPGPKPYFLKVDPGLRFCLLHEPPSGATRRGCIVYVHPFAEELNKTRRMAALQAQALSLLGFSVLLIDLYGCGDSSGDFSDARWSDWRQDIACACAHILALAAGPLILWGTRLGALLALDHAATMPEQPAALLFWQPVLSGDTHLRQFFRLQSAARLLSPELEPSDINEAAVEVGGYIISRGLQCDIRALDTQSLRPACPVLWLEQPGSSSLEVPQASANVIQRWAHAGTRIKTAVTAGPQFWATSEVTECPSFLAATQKFLMQDGWNE